MTNHNRRNFIKLSLLASAAALLVGCESTAEGGLMPEKKLGSDSINLNGLPDVLVLGAGMAGLGAARTLQDSGLKVTLLEGRSRIGGRVWSSRAWPDVPLDMGANVEMRQALSKPVEDRLFFAGEATSIKNPATVHGAYLSGLREAERILSL